MVCLLDFDWACYRACYGKSDYIQKIESLEYWIDSILTETKATDYRIFLTGTTNFRYEVYPGYKASRKGKPKPEYYYELREYLTKYWNAEISEGMEADDMCALYACEDSVVVGLDKDLLTIAGIHYRIKNTWNENHFLTVTEDDANLNFWIQVLTGDNIDDVPGIKNPAKSHHKNPPNFSWETANELLLGLTKEERREKVTSLYKEQFGVDWSNVLDRNARLLWLMRSHDTTYSDYV